MLQGGIDSADGVHRRDSIEEIGLLPAAQRRALWERWQSKRSSGLQELDGIPVSDTVQAKSWGAANEITITGVIDPLIAAEIRTPRGRQDTDR
jgi:hypothetical protein